MIHHLVFCCVNHRHQCNFGPEDKSDVVPGDMQALLKAIQKRRKNKVHDQKKRKGKKVIPEFDSFPVNNDAE